MFRHVSRDIVKGGFNYDECFDSFINSTNQKQDTALLLSHIVNGLKELGLICQETNKAIQVADIGCANAAASSLFLEAINHFGRYDYQGIDISKRYTNEAQDKLRDKTFIQSYKVIEGDALCGNLSQTSFGPKKFDFVLVSHAAYYLDSAEVKCQNFISDMQQLLSPEGIVLFMHGSSHDYLLSKYSKNSTNMHMPSVRTHVRLEQCAEKLAFKSTSIDFVSKLRFDFLEDHLWEAMKKIENYQLLQTKPEVISNLEKLSFIINRSLSELEQEEKLQQFVQDAKDIIANNGGFLYLHTHLQVMISNECQVSLVQIAEKLKMALRKNPQFMITDEQLLTLNQHPQAIKQENALTG